MDLRNPPPQFIARNWIPPMYHGSGNQWTARNIGQVFGVTVDRWGNIYVAATMIYDLWSLSTSTG